MLDDLIKTGMEKETKEINSNNINTNTNTNTNTNSTNINTNSLSSDSLSETNLDYERIKRSYETINEIIKNKTQDEVFLDLYTYDENCNSFTNSNNYDSRSTTMLEHKKSISIYIEYIYKFSLGTSNEKNINMLLEVCDLAFGSDDVSNQDLSEYKTISDLLPLASKDFLKNKIGLTETQITTIKKDNEKNIIENENIIEKDLNNSNNQIDTNTLNSINNLKIKPIKSKSDNVNTNIITVKGELESILNKTKEKQKIKNTTNNNNNSANNTTNNSYSMLEKEKLNEEKEKLDKEIEEEHFKEMIQSAKSIKNYANTFKKTFEKDFKVIIMLLLINMFFI